MTSPAPAALKFCSACGSDRIERRIPEGDNLPRFVCAACGAIHYQNPKIVVGCLPEWEDRVLLCRRAIEPRHGLWTLPAGFLENGETVEAGALRETQEEAGARVALAPFTR
jgi:NADH pyrophosphatase NudC (nudix superfamily)